jgi:hypothetical protein
MRRKQRVYRMKTKKRASANALGRPENQVSEAEHALDALLLAFEQYRLFFQPALLRAALM